MYSTAFEKAVNHAMLYEVGGWWKLTPDVQAGLCDTPSQKKAVGYVNDPVDPGGETKFGVAKNANPDINILRLDWEGAKAIYYSHYWLNGKCDKMPGRIAALHFDACVNHGPSQAAKFLQRALGVTDDGDIGPVTLGKLSTLDVIATCNAICAQRAKFYNDLVVSKPVLSKYLSGWLRRVEEMRVFVTDANNSF